VVFLFSEDKQMQESINICIIYTILNILEWQPNIGVHTITNEIEHACNPIKYVIDIHSIISVSKHSGFLKDCVLYHIFYQNKFVFNKIGQQIDCL